MNYSLKLLVTPKTPKLSQEVQALSLADTSVEVQDEGDDFITLGVDYDVAPGDIIRALNEALGTVTLVVYPEGGKARTVEDTVPDVSIVPEIHPTDVLKLRPEANSVWDTLFKKPPPVFDRQHWAELDVSDKFIYVPNCTRYEGAGAEDYASNSMYTLVMLNAYQAVCKAHGINPLVHFVTGAEVPVLILDSFHAVQTHIEGERASGFVDSVLVDFNDAWLAEDFIKQVSLLTSEQCQSEPARQTVLAKAELILAGKSSHVYNQRFVKDVISLLTVNYANEMTLLFKANGPQARTTLINLFRGMIIDGFVLESSIEEFKQRLWTAGLGEYQDFICKVYEEVTPDG